MRSRLCAALSLAACLAIPSAAAAQEPIRFARTPDISPDGKLIAFSYLGDIWTVEAIGGVARPVTMHEAHDINPMFSPDGKWLAFSSNRHGSYDVFVVPVVGGKPRRLTYDSAPDMVTGWSPDGKQIVFASPRSPAFPPNIDCYTVPVEGGAVERLPLFEGKEAHLSPVGNMVAFVRGPGTWYRRGYRGSSNDDIWLSNRDGSIQKPLTKFDGQDSSPMWAPDGRKLYYVSELGSKPGCANIVAQNLSGLAAEGGYQRLTQHEDETVRQARISRNGEWIVYECGSGLWVVGTKSPAPPRLLAIEVNADDKTNTERTVTFTRDATEFALNADEDAAVVTVQGELFLLPLPAGGKTTRLTESPAFDHAAVFSPDGKSILFLSDRSGTEDIYLLEPDDPEHSELAKAHKFKIRRLTNTPEAETQATFSPSGDRVVFVRSGKLWIMKPDGSGPRVLAGGDGMVSDYDWSPDGKMLVYSRMDGSFASELFVIATEGTAAPRNITRYATYNGDVSWSRTGGKIGFISQRRGLYAPHVLSLQKPGTPGGAGEIDWDDIHLRANRVAGVSADNAVISPNGQQIAFRHSGTGDDLWVASSNGSAITRVTLSTQSPRNILWSRKSSNLIYFLNGQGEVRSIRAAGPLGVGTGSLSADPLRIGFQAKMTVRRDEEFAEMFVQCWQALSDSFYDSKHHNTDWPAVRARYQPLVGHVALREDMYALVSLMLGELNASHLGISGRLPVPDEPTAELGLIFDDAYRGPGLRIREVLKRGPADRRGLDIKPGDFILAIDRVELTNRVNLSRLLNNKAGEGVLLDVAGDAQGAKKRRVEVVAADRNRIAQLMYERWVQHNADAVAAESAGKIGYIHIPTMDDAGLEVFIRSLYSDHFDKDAIVIDVRYNGGGFTHDHVLNYLAGKEHTVFRQRDGGAGLVLRSDQRKWNRPLAVLTNNRSYSDAEIFPHAFRSLGLGKVVGQATGGFVIGTTSTRLIDGSTFRLPRTGVFTSQGVNLEGHGVTPDVAVEIGPEDWRKGIDPQLQRAVSVLAADVKQWRARKSVVPAPAPSAPGGVAPIPMAD